jgi:hypothetical protein
MYGKQQPRIQKLRIQNNKFKKLFLEIYMISFIIIMKSLGIDILYIEMMPCLLESCEKRNFH